MGNSNFTFDVGVEDFYQKVIEGSHEKIIVVDFWASWCAPCKVLGPLLEKVVASFGGRVLLAKVNIEEHQELAVHFRIQSIPSVKIFSKGDIVQEFLGAIPENKIIEIIKSVAGDEMGDSLSKAETLITEKKYGKAEDIYKKLLEKEPKNSGAKIGLARIALVHGDTDSAEKLLSEIDEMDSLHEKALSLANSIEFFRVCTASGGLEKCRKNAEQDPGNLEMLYNLGCCYAADNAFEPAFDTFLSVVKRDSGFGEGKARTAMITLFSILGQNHELTRRYRDRLANALF